MTDFEQGQFECLQDDHWTLIRCGHGAKSAKLAKPGRQLKAAGIPSSSGRIRTVKRPTRPSEGKNGPIWKRPPRFQFPMVAWSISSRSWPQREQRSVN